MDSEGKGIWRVGLGGIQAEGWLVELDQKTEGNSERIEWWRGRHLKTGRLADESLRRWGFGQRVKALDRGG